jgi:hypothetical protein
MLLERLISSFVCLCYAPAGFLHKMLYQLVGKTEIWVKNSEQFLQLNITVNIRGLGKLVSFDVVRLFTNIPAEEALEIIGNKLLESDKLAKCSVLEVDAIMELLEVCLKTTYF